jgi:acetylornithine deacetylase
MTFEQFLRNLICFDTVSSNSNLPLISFVEFNLKKLGFTTEQFLSGNKANLFAYKQSSNRIIFAAHTDTVPASEGWDSEPFDLTKDNGILTGLGVVDMKGFLATALAFAEENKDDKRLAFLLTFEEETCFNGAKQINSEIIKPSDFVILGEPTNNQIMTKHKGLLQYKAILTGKSGHGSEPTKGLSAISEGAKLVRYLEKYFPVCLPEMDNAFSNPQATFNIGKISGGDAVNKIPEICELDIDVRIISLEQKKMMEKLFENFPTKGKLETKLILNLAPFQTAPELVEKLDSLGLKIKKGASYTTEASFYTKLTDKLIVFGPGDESQAHMVNESAKISDFEEYQRMLTILCQNI